MERSKEIILPQQWLSSTFTIFCAASPADETLLVHWETFLLPLVEHAHLVSVWSERHLSAGESIEQERLSHLDQADLILLLLSPDFFASQSCLQVMQRALQRQHDKTARVIPLLLRPVDWQTTELGSLVPWPTNGIPVVQWNSQEEAWHACVLGLHSLLRLRLSASSHAFLSRRAQRRATSDRERFLVRLQRTYHELLDRSLHGITWMDLGLSSKPDAVRNASHLLFRLPQRDEQMLSPVSSILQAYEEAQEELLIMGAPGAGKSTLLLDLAVQLVERAVTDETDPLPVILPLSSWAVRRMPIASWLIEQLAYTYDVPRKLSERWVEQEHILPLLDGLDEMKDTARSACIAAINTYHSAHLTPLVVCSRQGAYEMVAVQQRLMLQSAVIVQPLTAEQIDTSLRMAGPVFSNLREVLHRYQAVRELATTPLMLSVLLLTYKETSLGIAARSGINLEQQVWTDYVARMVQQKGNEARYPLERTRHWLAWLAQQMLVHQQTIFYAEYMQADWLLSKQQRMVTWLSIRVPMTVLGFIACLLVSVFVSNVPGPVLLLQMGLLGGVLGICMSQNIDADPVDVSRHPSISKRADLAISILLAVLVAASFGLSLRPPSLQDPGYSLSDWVRDGSILSLGSGLGAWIFQLLLFRVPRQRTILPHRHPSPRWHVFAWFNTIAASRALQAAIVFGTVVGLSQGLSVGLGVGLNNGLNQGPSDGLSDGLRIGLTGGLSGALSLALTALILSVILNTSTGTLRFTERVSWQWKSLIQPGHLRTSLIIASVMFLLTGLSYGLSIGLVTGLSDGLSAGLSDALSTMLSGGLSVGLSAGLSYWLLLGLYQGMKQEHIEDQDRHQFNQGIHRSLRNGALISLISTSIIAGMGVLSYGLSDALSTGMSDALSNGLTSGIDFGLSHVQEGLSQGLSYLWIPLISGAVVTWAISGGLTILQHYLIRWFLARSRSFPWRAQEFLDDATARMLLQRIGGGYRFMHRRLLDFFAGLKPMLPTQDALANIPTLPLSPAFLDDTRLLPCGHEQRSIARFCSVCGTPIPP